MNHSRPLFCGILWVSPAGTALVMVTEALTPGLRVRELPENEVPQLEGALELRLKVVAGHAGKSLLVTVTE